MAGFRLTGKALLDVAEVIGFQHDQQDAASADKIENLLFHAFRDLAEYPQKGHRRSDLTPKNRMFYYAEPYFILFRRIKDRVQMLRIAHKSRDLRKFLKNAPWISIAPHPEVPRPRWETTWLAAGDTRGPQIRPRPMIRLPLSNQYFAHKVRPLGRWLDPNSSLLNILRKNRGRGNP